MKICPRCGIVEEPYRPHGFDPQHGGPCRMTLFTLDEMLGLAPILVVPERLMQKSPTSPRKHSRK